MAKSVAADELHLTVRSPVDLPETEAEAVRKTLLNDAFLSVLKRAVRHAFRAFPELSAVRLTLTR